MDVKEGRFDKKELRKAIIKSVGGKKLQKIGNSLAIVIPNMWARANATDMDGGYYVKFRYLDGDTIQISPVDKDELKALLEVNNAQ